MAISFADATMMGHHASSEQPQMEVIFSHKMKGRGGTTFGENGITSPS